MRLLHFSVAFIVAMAAFGDTVTLKDGRVITGTYLGGSPRQVKMEVADQIKTFDISDIARIEFGGGPVANAEPVAPPPPPPDAPPVMRRAADAPPPAEAAPPRMPDPPPPPPDQPRNDDRVLPPDGAIQLAAGTNIVVRMIDGVDSEKNSVGQTFAASIDEPVMINGQTVIPRGADAVVKLVDAKESGKLTGRTSLTLDLMSVKVNGRMVDVNTQTVSEESASRGARTAKVAGGAAAVGTIIGAIAGGGKGAAIGAGAGGAAGAGAETVTKGQRVKIPSETRLTFTLDTAVRI